MEEEVEENGESRACTVEQKIQKVRSGKASQVCGKIPGCLSKGNGQRV
jgi:hypothetical protein